MCNKSWMTVVHLPASALVLNTHQHCAPCDAIQHPWTQPEAPPLRYETDVQYELLFLLHI